MNLIKKILKNLDFFGISFSFRIEKKETYSTSLGGLFVIIFCIVALYLGIYNFISFLHRDNFSIIYYTMNIPITENIIFKQSKSAIAIGYDCSTYGRFKVDDIFTIEIRYVIYKKDELNKYNKNKTLLPVHSCKYDDFYNVSNNAFDYLHISDYLCLDSTDHIITGIWDDPMFSYYEFSLKSKYDTPENLNIFI